MDTPKAELVSEAPENDGMDTVPSDIESRHEDFMTTKVLFDTTQQNYETLRLENDQLTSKVASMETENETLKLTVVDLSNKVETATAEVTKLSSQVAQQESELNVHRKKRDDLSDEREMLLKMSDRKDVHIDHLNGVIRKLEEQLQSAVGAKFEALARLDEIAGKEQKLSQKERQMDMEKELLHSEIASLRDNLNRTTAETLALRHELTTTSVQFDIDLKRKTEELRTANSTIQLYSDTNQTLTNQCEENIQKLREQKDESCRLMERYQKELDSKVALAEMHKEDCDSYRAQIEELSAGMKERQRILDETIDQCGVYETKLKEYDDQHQTELDERDDAIAQLKQELKVVNEMLEKADEENQERMVDNYIPSANAMNRRLKSGLTFTEICTRYFSLVEQVKVKDQDIANLKLQFETVYQDIQEKAPEFDRVQVEYKKAVALNEELTRKIDDYIAERVVIRDELANSRSKFGYLERENAKLKTSRNDLARQVCYLLNEIECSRGGTSSEQDQSISSDMPANEVISSKLVTFSNIIEMQQNNEKLLLLVRDLSTKLEEMEEIQNTIDIETYESKCTSYEKRLQDAEEARRANEELLGNCLREKDRYKQMVCDLMKETNKPTAGDQSRLGRSVSAMDVGDSTALNGSFGAAKEVNDKKVADLEQMLEEKVKQLQELRDEYSEYRKESKHTVKSMNEQFRSERDELRELTTANCKLQTQAAFLSEQIKTQQNNVGIYKNKIQTLEERNQTYEKTIAKHETSAKYMREEALTTMKKLQSLEVRCEHLQRENNKLIAENRQLEMQYQLLNRERVTNSSLQNNLEMIRGSFERWETDGRAKMEQRLDDTNRECFALRRRLQEEQDEYRKQIAKIKSDTQDSEKKFKDQLLEVETLRAQLKNVQEQLELKNQQLNELTNKMQNSPAMAHIDVPAVVDTAKIKELELQVLNAAAEIQKLTTQNSVSAVREARLRQVATEWEEEALKQKESFDMWKSKMAADLEAAQLNEAKLAAKVDELQTEIRLQAMETDSSMYDAAAENKARLELKDALQKISERERELRDLRTETNQLKIDLKTIEQKYSNEMQVHSADIQALTMCKDELNKCQEQIDQVRAEKDVAIDILKSSQSEFENLNKKLNEDKLELEQKLEYLNNQNTALHDHLQAQCNKATSSNDSMNESVNSSFLNRSLTDDEAKEVSSDKLLKVITYLRKEKDSSFMKVEILKNENTRLLSEIELLKKRLTEQAHQLSVSETPINAPNVVSASKYEELMRKVETLNSVTESNIHLRAEKEALAAKVNDLTERVTKVEDELFPLQEKNRELTAKNEEQAHVNQMLRNNVDHWRKRSSDLVDRNNKNPEEFKRLQNERENLAKMLTVEKNTVSNVNAQLAALTNEKAKTEQELAANVRLLHATSEEKKKIQDDLNALKQQNTRLTQEIIEIKSQILKKEDDIKAVQTELTSKENLILEIKKKEVQIRQIAKKYKDSYFDLKSNVDTRQADLAAKPLEEQVAATNDADAAGVAARAEMEKIQTKKVEELSNQLLARQEEIEQLQKEIENLKKQDDKNLLAEARNRIAALTETNRQITRDYQVSKNQLQTCEQSRSEHDSVLAALKSQLEAKIKELLDQDAARQETIARLTRENETLNTRVNQLHRQFQQQGSKPSTSSGTIEKSPSDPARTANVKPMATPSAQQSATVNPRRGGDTPLASIRPVPVQNSRIAAVLPTSQTSNVATVQGSSSAGNVTTALVPPQQQVHTTGNTSTAEAMSSSPTSSHTDYMPATSSAAVVVAAVPPMGSASAESTQEAESLSVNTNESSSSSSSQAVMQQQTVALVSPRVEVAPQNVSIPSQQVVDQAASTSGSTSSSFITAMSSHHQASSSNTVTTSQAGHKRPRDADGDSSTGVEESSASEKNSPQNKRTRVGEQTFQGVTESGLDVEYQVPTSSQRDQEYDVVAVDSDEDEENMDAVDVDENFEGDNNDTDEIESFGQDEGEGIDIDEDAVPNDSNEVDVVDDSSNAPNQSSSGLAVSSEARGNVAEVIELSPSGQENQQIQTISSGSDAGPSSQANLWRQAQTPTRQQQQQQQQQQQSLVIQQAYEEMTDDSIVPSTPTLYVARRADGFSEAVSSPHPTVPHGSRFPFGESNANRSVVPSIEGMDDTRVDLNLLDGSADNAQNSAANVSAQQNSDVVVVDLSDDNSSENKEADQREPVAGPSTEASVPQIMVTDTENDQNTFDESASTSQLTDDKGDTIEADAQDEDDVEADGVSSGQDGIQVEEGREAESTQMVTDKRTTRQTRQDSQRLIPIVWDGGDSSPQQRGINRGTLNRGQVGRGGGGRGRGKRPFHS